MEKEFLPLAIEELLEEEEVIKWFLWEEKT